MDTIPIIMNRLALVEGVNKTRLSQVRIYKASEFQTRQPLCYDQGVIIVGQGTKQIFIEDTSYEYNPDNYLVLSVPLPAECETRATPESPLLSLILDLDIPLIKDLLKQIPEPPLNQSSGIKTQGLFLAKATFEIKDTTLRLLQALESPLEAKVMGPSIFRELMFRIVCGENGATLAAISMQNTKISRVDKALKQIHGNYDRPMDVDELASLVHMSPSAFHRAFKEVTASSPIQYIKKSRLDKARDLITAQGLRVNEAATRVGYESPNQFSREFKRYFGASPISFISGQA